jgi:hypothetical protein
MMASVAQPDDVVCSPPERPLGHHPRKEIRQSMATLTHSRPPLQPGEPAPDFALPTVPEDGVVSLADYRGRSALLLVLLRTVGG